MFTLILLHLLFKSLNITYYQNLNLFLICVIRCVYGLEMSFLVFGIPTSCLILGDISVRFWQSPNTLEDTQYNARHYKKNKQTICLDQQVCINK